MIKYTVTNPSTGRVEKEYRTHSDARIQDALSRATAGEVELARTSVAQRSALLHRVADLYAERRETLASIITREMGKPIFQAGIEIDIVISIFRYYANNGSLFLADEELQVAAGGRAIIQKEAVGVLLGIMPWNFPYYQVARFVAPNLMIGNPLLLKHAPQCPESSLAIEQIFKDAGAPDGAYVNIFASNEQVADIIADQRIKGVSLTGSERAGIAIAELAGRNLKKVVLELGGSDPFIVLADADVKAAAAHGLLGRFGNAGQACNAAKRFIIDAKVFSAFAEQFTDLVRNIKVGDPSNAESFMGPLSSMTARDSLAEQVQDAIDKGATVLTGGNAISGVGAYYEPTVLTDVTPEMRVYHEELFGPVAVLYRVNGEDEAVALANDSTYGLGASVHTADEERATRLAGRLEVGMVSINEPSGTAAELPFGGIKRSGIGRELGKYGIEEFVNKKLVKFPA